MRSTIIGTVLVVMSTSVSAQQPPAQSPAQAMKSFVSSADVAALVAKAKSERKDGQAIFVQPLLKLGPYTLNLEYRVAGVVAPAAVHERDAELFYVVDGSATVVTGGRLVNATRTNADNFSGTAIEGGAAQHVAKGDVLMVPEGRPHWFSVVDGTVVVMSLHLPHPPRTAP